MGVGWHREPWFPGKRPVLVGMTRRGKGVGSLQASGFPFADIAFWAAVAICSLERGLQENVPCLEMTSSPSLAGDWGWLLSGRYIRRMTLPGACGLSQQW